MVDVSELKKLEIFSIFSDKQLDQLAKMTDKKKFKANSHVYEHGERAKYLFVVTKGLVSLRELKPGDTVGIAFEMRERGELFGAACFMKPQQYTLTGVCMEESEVLAIDADKLYDLCEADAEVGFKLMKKVAMLYFERYKNAKRQLFEMVKAPTIVTALPG
jgi:CRP/FNR family transcriptional regulator, cyclic AMP receptor protein